jgi:hypothetical protein
VPESADAPEAQPGHPRQPSHRERRGRPWGRFGGWAWTPPQAQPEADNGAEAEGEDEEESGEEDDDQEGEEEAKPFTKEEKRELKRQFWRYINSGKSAGPRRWRRHLFKRLWGFRKGFGGRRPWAGFGGPTQFGGYGGAPWGGFGWPPHGGTCGKKGKKAKEESAEKDEKQAEPADGSGKGRKHGHGKQRGQWGPPGWGFGGW